MISKGEFEDGFDAEVAKALEVLKNYPEMKGFTSFLVFPKENGSFEYFNDFCAVIEDKLKKMGLLKHLQVLVFHPEFRFEEEDVERSYFVNRSPYPMIHLLWQKDVEEVVQKFGEEKTYTVARNNYNKLVSLSEQEFKDKILKYMNPNWRSE